MSIDPLNDSRSSPYLAVFEKDGPRLIIAVGDTEATRRYRFRCHDCRTTTWHDHWTTAQDDYDNHRCENTP